MNLGWEIKYGILYGLLGKQKNEVGYPQTWREHWEDSGDWIEGIAHPGNLRTMEAWKTWIIMAFHCFRCLIGAIVLRCGFVWRRNRS